MSEQQATVIAVDVGGTFTKVAAVNRAGEAVAGDAPPTPVDLGGRGVTLWLADLVRDWADGHAGAGFCVAVPGIIANGFCHMAANIGWRDEPLQDLLRDQTGLPGIVTQDVRAAGWAEWRVGAGRGCDSMLFMPLGTGIAGAVVVDGTMIVADGYAGEIGHMPVPVAGDRACACGAVGCLEAWSSAASVRRRHTEAGGDPDWTTAQIADAARSGDALAARIIDEAALGLAQALYYNQAMLGSAKVVIGGGMSGAFDLLAPRITEELSSLVSFHRMPELVVAELGSRSGQVGAALLGWDAIDAATGQQPAPGKTQQGETS